MILMNKKHPSYTHEPLQEDLAREHFLHRLVAGSAFLFALCILPVSQYFLLGNHVVDQNGQVLGIATEAPTTLGVVATPNSLLDCAHQKQADEDNVDSSLAAREQKLTTDHQVHVTDYTNALAQLTGVTDQDNAQRVSIQKLEDAEVTTYQNAVQTAETTAATQKQEIDARDCPAQ